MKYLAVLAVVCLVSLPSAASAFSLWSGTSNGGGSFGVSNGNSAFSFSWGNGGTGAFACASTICSVAQTFIYIINAVLVPLLFAIAFITFLYGVFKKYIWSRGDEGAVEEGHKLILWGIIGFAIMISLWGLVNVVVNTFGLGGFSAPPTPTSY